DFGACIPNSSKLTLPLRATASISADEKLIRFFPTSPDFQSRLVRIHFEYKVDFETNVEESGLPLNSGKEGASDRKLRRGRDKSSAGLISLITSVLAKRGVLVLSLENGMVDRPRHLNSTQRPRDHGVIRVSATLPEIRGENAYDQ